MHALSAFARGRHHPDALGHGRGVEAGRSLRRELESETVVVQRRAALQDSLASVTEQVEAARDEVARSFETLKKYEITKAGRDAEALAEVRRQERSLLDEVGLSAYARNKDSRSGPA